MLLRPQGLVGIMGDIVEKHQARMDGILEVQNVQTGGSLVETVTIAAFIESQQAAQDETDRCLVRDYYNVFILVIDDDLSDDRQGTCQDTDTRFPILRSKCKWIGLT